MKTIFGLFLLFALNACSFEQNYYVKKVDYVNISSVSMPDTVLVSEKVEINAQAEANNGCWSNLYFVLSKYDNFNYNLEAFGTFQSQGFCAEMMVYKDSVIEFKPTAQGIYYFHITQVPLKVNIDTLIVK